MSLEEFFIQGKLNNNYKLWAEIMKHHGGLGAMMQRKIGKGLEPYEIQSFMYQSLGDAITMWDKSVGKASTAWYKATWKLVSQYTRDTSFVGCVKVPVYNKHSYASKCFEENDIQCVYYIDEDVDAAL